MRIVGVILIAVGVVALAYGGFSYTRSETVLDAGPLEVTTQSREQLAVPPLVGGVLLATGAVLLISRRRK